jgi:hypothetical protein
VTPQNDGGGAGVPAPDAANTVQPAPAKKPVTAKLSHPIPLQRQSDDAHPSQPALPGMEMLVDDVHTWEGAAEAVLDQFEATGAIFTAMDLRRLAGLPESRNRIGLAIARAARRGAIVELGALRSSAPSRRAGLVRLWRGRGGA